MLYLRRATPAVRAMHHQRFVPVAGEDDFSRGTRASPESERIGLQAAIKKLDLEGSVRDRAALPDELIEPLSGHNAAPLDVDIRAMVFARWFTVDRDTKANRPGVVEGPKYEMQIAGMESVDDAAARCVEKRLLVSDRPVTGQSPLVQSRLVCCIDIACVANRATR